MKRPRSLILHRRVNSEQVERVLIYFCPRGLVEITENFPGKVEFARMGEKAAQNRINDYLAQGFREV